ncbi:hypothetical protein NMY22_g12436 [Coprinellus aureogranulatus]|nr:hypothetical protein NMY22_g12436 [Coprinellus aureogranulatus]
MGSARSVKKKPAKTVDVRLDGAGVRSRFQAPRAPKMTCSGLLRLTMLSWTSQSLPEPVSTTPADPMDSSAAIPPRSAEATSFAQQGTDTAQMQAFASLQDILNAVPADAQTLPQALQTAATESLQRIYEELPPEARAHVLSLVNPQHVNTVAPPEAIASLTGHHFGDEDDLDVDLQNEVTGVSVGQRVGPRVYPSNRNPVHGFIEGLARGNEPISLARVRALKAVYEKNSDAVKAFDTLIRDLFTRCEDIANRTSCWLYIAVQHPSSRQAFAHYASPKFRREAGEDMGKIHEAVGRTMANLTLAARLESIELLRQKSAALEQAKAAEARAESAEARLQAAEARLKLAEAQLQAASRGGLLSFD